ncbi:MAG: sugar phosphate isomerase/epimerase family protein [Burkholderiaceae bacterium]|jgi:sugar phosphate isomerase/epimerase
MRDFSSDHRWLSVNTATVRKQWKLDAIIEECTRRGIGAIAPWRDQVSEIGLDRAVRLVRDHALALSGYCRGGMFPAASNSERHLALEDNRRAVDEALSLGAPCLILVVGGLPNALSGQVAYRDLARARAEVHDGIAATLEYATTVGLALAIEPLHPMYAADRACVNTLEQALDLCDAIDPDGSKRLGVAVDVYHVWWDPKLEAQIQRAGRRRLLAFHVSDWLVPTRDLLLDRGMMGDGVIEIRKIRSWVEAAGFDGYSEVEIFSERDWWQRPGGEVLDTVIARHRAVV